MEEDKDFLANQDYYKDFYFIYVLTGANYIRPLIKYMPNIPNGTNVVVLTNTPKILENIKPTNFNLIVEDLEKYRDDWSRENEKVLDIEDEQAYMEEYRRIFNEENYRYPMGIMRFGMNWAFQNNVKKFILVDVGCKIGFENNNVTDTAFKRIEKLAKEKNVVFGKPTFYSNDEFKAQIKYETPLLEVIKKYIPDISLENYPETVSISYYEYDEIKKETVEILDDKASGAVGFDGYCYGMWVHDINVIKVAFDFWSDITKKLYETDNTIKDNPNNIITHFEPALMFVASLLSKYYNTIISPHHTLVSHFYQPENDWVINKMKHMDFQPANSREEFIRINKDKLFLINGEEVSKIIMDGL
jgi:hypothetical protein